MLNDGAQGAMRTTRVDALTGFLKGTGTAYELVEHEQTTTAAAEARVTHLPPDRVAKTIVLHDGSGYVVAAIPACDRLDLRKLRGLLGATRRLRLASEYEIARDFPLLEVGAVPPFGPMVTAAEVIDSTLTRHEQILCPAGDRCHSVLLDPREIVRITAARTADICEE